MSTPPLTLKVEGIFYYSIDANIWQEAKEGDALLYIYLIGEYAAFIGGNVSVSIPQLRWHRKESDSCIKALICEGKYGIGRVC